MNKEPRKPLVSVTKEDFDIQTFRVGGHGGQKVNKTSSGVRIIHRASGARAESREHRTQGKNKIAAFIRLTETSTFKNWLKIETARALGQEVEVEASVKRAMAPQNIRTEVKDEKGRWVEE